MAKDMLLGITRPKKSAGLMRPSGIDMPKGGKKGSSHMMVKKPRSVRAPR